MIGKPEWFKRRKYGGWGIGTPTSWKGWVYLGAVFIPFAIFMALPFWSNTVRIVVAGIWALFLLVDVTSIMIRMGDEREKTHEAFAERNALWAMLLVLVIGISYQISVSAVKQDFSEVDIFLVIAVVLGIVVKAISNIYLDRKN